MDIQNTTKVWTSSERAAFMPQIEKLAAKFDTETIGVYAGGVHICLQEEQHSVSIIRDPQDGTYYQYDEWCGYDRHCSYEKLGKPLATYRKGIEYRGGKRNLVRVETWKGERP